jgi:hypothetical protein
LNNTQILNVEARVVILIRNATGSVADEINNNKQITRPLDLK